MYNNQAYLIAGLKSYKENFKPNGKPLLRSKNYKIASFDLNKVSTSENISLLTCNLCKGYPREPIKLCSCGHLFCFRCYYHQLKRLDDHVFGCSRHPSTCPQCNLVYGLFDIYMLSESDPTLFQKILSARVTCANGCGAVASPVDMQDHELWQCALRPVQCSNIDCEEILPAKEMDAHLDI